MTDPILRTEGLTKNFDGVVATNDVSISVPRGELRCIIGPNGAGKSTLFSLLCGMHRADAGRVLLKGEDVTRLLESKSELGINLTAQKADLEKFGVPTEVRIRHGIVVDEVFAEARERSYDLIVTGSSQARGMLRHYIMGDLTRSILNHANCPVLVARAGAVAGPRGLWRSIRRAFAAPKS